MSVHQRLSDVSTTEPHRAYGNLLDRELKQPENPYVLLRPAEKKVVLDSRKLGIDIDPAHIITNQLTDLCHKINIVHGAVLLSHSRKFFKRHERAWFFCRVFKRDWLKSQDEQLPVVVNMCSGVWPAEPNKRALVQLYEMDPNTEYMLSWEIYEDDENAAGGAGTLLFYSQVMNSESPTPKASTRGVKLELETGTYNNSHLKALCYGCLGFDPERKLKLCSGCRVVRFCSERCQQHAWTNAHRNCCATLNKLRLQRNGNSQ